MTPLTVGSCTTSLITLPSISDCDLIEVRLDSKENLSDLIKTYSQAEHDLLITARDIKEGGLQDLPINERSTRLVNFMEHARYIDVEMLNWDLFSDALSLAKKKELITIASYHDFEKTPSYAEISELISIHRGKADILKFAFMTHSLQDIKVCQDILFNHKNLKISIMGMGAYAPVSRLLLAQSGSVLNYGYLGDTPTAPGQWSAPLLKQAINLSSRISE